MAFELTTQTRDAQFKKGLWGIQQGRKQAQFVIVIQIRCSGNLRCVLIIGEGIARQWFIVDGGRCEMRGRIAPNKGRGIGRRHSAHRPRRVRGFLQQIGAGLGGGGQEGGGGGRRGVVALDGRQLESAQMAGTEEMTIPWTYGLSPGWKQGKTGPEGC